MIELSGVSSTALFNKYGIGPGGQKPSVNAAEEAERMKQATAMQKTKMEFMEPQFSFGKIKEGTVVTHKFHFKNTGPNPLLIVKATASCGCTVPSFSKQPIAPGGEGDIDVQFNSTHRTGHQDKHIIVFSNAAEDRMSIGFTADVE